MNVYIWLYVEAATNNYHDGGGIVCVDESLESARAAIAEATPREEWGKENQPSECEAMVSPPDYILPTSSLDPLVLVFPDAGCC
jgi:hypothetical protein